MYSPCCCGFFGTLSAKFQAVQPAGIAIVFFSDDSPKSDGQLPEKKIIEFGSTSTRRLGKRKKTILP